MIRAKGEASNSRITSAFTVRSLISLATWRHDDILTKPWHNLVPRTVRAAARDSRARTSASGTCEREDRVRVVSPSLAFVVSYSHRRHYYGRWRHNISWCMIVLDHYNEYKQSQDRNEEMPFTLSVFVSEILSATVGLRPSRKVITFLQAEL